MGDKVSCSACCGLFNLKMTDAERTVWVQKNTDTFLATDISKAENIVAYRKEREAETLPLRSRDDIYVCPFVGFVKNQRTGCLLHPQGSPHPQIGLWAHPQNFSFYGEGICLAYDCLAKERRAYRSDFFPWAETAPLYAYARLASDHTLHRALSSLAIGDCNLSAFYTLLAELYETNQIVTTSFEDVEKTLPSSIEELCLFLARRIRGENSSRDIQQRLLAVF